jgi:hypothetical protein
MATRAIGRSTHRPELSDGELAQFWSEGFLRLGQVVPPGEIEALRRRADEILLGDVSYILRSNNTVLITHQT